MGVPGFGPRTRIQQQLDGLFGSECGGTVQRRRASRATIAHEAAGLDTDLRHSVGVGSSGQQNSNNLSVGRALRLAKRRVQWRLSGVWQRMVYPCAALNEELAQPPVPMRE